MSFIWLVGKSKLYELCDSLEHTTRVWIVSLVFTPTPVIPGYFSGSRDHLAFNRLDLFFSNTYASTAKLLQFLRMGAVNC